MDAVPVTLGQEFSGYAARSRPASSRCACCPGWAAGDRRHRGGYRPPSRRLRRQKWVGAGRAEPVCPELRTATSLPEAQAAATRLVGVRERCARSRPRSPTTSAGWDPGPLTGLAEIHCQICGRAARSCREGRSGSAGRRRNVTQAGNISPGVGPTAHRRTRSTADDGPRVLQLTNVSRLFANAAPGLTANVEHLPAAGPPG